MNRQSHRGRLLASTFIGAGAFAVFCAAPAFAADAPVKVEEVVVTGSRIPHPNLQSVSPISTVTSQDVKLSGATDVVDLLESTPQVVSEFGNQPNALSSVGGLTTISLRGLGSARTLVLQDGKRLAPGDPSFPSPDVDNVPSQLVDRIEVVTGGASAVYGSDALAGVVNFVMKKNYEGLQIDTQYGFNQHSNHDGDMQARIKAAITANKIGPLHLPDGDVSDGETFNLSVLMGSNSADGKGNVTAYLSYRNAKPVLEGSRDFSECQLKVTANVGACTGSSNSNLFFDTYSPTGATYSVVGTSFLPRPQAGSAPPSSFNSNEYLTMNRGDDRYQGGALAHYQIAPWLEAYMTSSFMYDHTRETAAPSAIFQQLSGAGAPNGGFLVNCDNPLLSAQEVNAICTSNGIGASGNADLVLGRRNVEGGARMYSYEHFTFRDVIGARGDIGDGWRYDLSAQYGFTKLNRSVHNDLSISHIANALQVVNVGGVPTCKVKVSGVDPLCVPYNLFRDGGVTPAALAYISDTGTTQGATSEQVVSFNLTGDLGKYGVKSPWAQSGVAVSLGAEYRRETLTNEPDQESLSGNLAGAGGASPATTGSFNVKEAFGEIRIPLIEGAPLARELSFEGGYRVSDYSSAGNTTAYKAALDWAPNDDLRVRGSIQRAVRAPNILELFAPVVVTNSTAFTDNCAKGAAPLASFTACQRTGVTAAQYGNGTTTNLILPCPSDQCAVATGGNASLKPEESDTKSLGLVFTPTFIPNFNLTVDWYKITVNKAISSVPASTTLANCEATGLAQYCDLIKRTPAGFLFGSSVSGGGFISTTGVNIATLSTAGYDVEANYHVGLADLGMGDHGSLNFAMSGTWTTDFNKTPLPGGPTYNCAGLYGKVCSLTAPLTAPLPRWRHTARVSWKTPWNMEASLRWRYIGSADLDSNTSQPGLTNGAHDSFDATIPAINYFDLSGTWRIKDGLTLRAGVNNIFDKDPPIVDSGLTGTGTPNTFSIYDQLGRHVFVGLTAEF